MPNSVVSLLEPVIDYSCMFRTGDFPPSGRMAALSALENYGFYKFVDSVHIPLLKVQALQTKDIDVDLFSIEVMRDCNVDGEDIYEQGIRPLVFATKDILSKVGYHIELAHEHWGQVYPFDYHVVLNDVEFLLWNESSFELNCDKWLLATNRAVQAINSLLRITVIEERFYISDDASLGLGLLLTSKMVEILYQYRAFVPLTGWQLPGKLPFFDERNSKMSSKLITVE